MTENLITTMSPCPTLPDKDHPAKRPRFPLSPWGRGREAMTYGCVAHASHVQDLEGAAVSHLAELVRGNCDKEGPLIRPFGPPSPQGEKGHAWLSQGNHNGGI